MESFSSAARDAVSSMRTRVSDAICTAVMPATTSTTSVVTPATCLAFIDTNVFRIGSSDTRGLGSSIARHLSIRAPEAPNLELPTLSGFLFHAIQFVVQRLQTDPEDLRGARLVVARVIQRQQDQPPLRLVDRRPRRQRHRRERLLALRDDRRRQMPGLDEVSLGQDRRPFDHVAQLTDVDRKSTRLNSSHLGIS